MCDRQFIEGVRAELLRHSVYSFADSAEKVRIFMENHVFAVWDFMSLLKRLQRDLTCVEVPWRRRLPDETTKYARFINEIVIGEETDDDGNGGFISHFGLYRQAMKECGARTEKIDRFLSDLETGVFLETALENSAVAPKIAEFVLQTVDLAVNGKTHEVCAAFFYGREEIIPDMFSALLAELESSGQAHSKLEYYLERHIEVDSGEHSVLAAELLDFLCGGDSVKIAEAENTAVSSLRSRIELWDAICFEMERCGATEVRSMVI